MNAGLLIVFSGLPGTGKTTLARGLAEVMAAVYLRIDGIEDGMRNSALRLGDVMDAGYRAIWEVAADNLELGHTVIGDSVNPVQATRAGWRNVAHRTGARLREVAVICSDPAIHAARIAKRRARGIGPTWQQVSARHYEARATPRLMVDTALEGIDAALARLAIELGPDSG